MIHLFFGILAWVIVALVFLTVYQFLAAGSRRVKRLHQIPCSECEYFTQASCLKCTVRPHWAGTELAIGCPDFEYYQERSPQL